MSLATLKHATYLKTARQRAHIAKPRDVKRYEQAWEVARRIASFIKERYPTARILAFGSLLYTDTFQEKSDIDLAVEGLAWRDYLQVWGELDKREKDFVIDLFDVGIVSKKLREHIEHEGQLL